MRFDKSNHPAYRKDIDGLRAIAILAVVAFHFFSSRLPGGFIGVDIFFVISGFLISGIIIHGLKNHQFSLRDFFIRRINRIFPALILVLLFFLLAGWYLLLNYEYVQFAKEVTAGSLFSANFLFLSQSGYFDAAAANKPLLHLWSLGVEEQFYIIWPLILLLSWRFKLGFLKVIIVVAFFSFLLNVILVHWNEAFAFFSPFTRFWELLAGALLSGLILLKEKYYCQFFATHLLNHVLSALGFGLILMGVFVVSESFAYPGWWALIPTVGAFLLILAGQEAWINKKLLASSVLVWIGLISYPLYLWHWPLLSFFNLIDFGLSKQIKLFALLLSFVMAFLTYFVVELPLKKRRNKKVMASVLLFIMFVIAFVSILLQFGHGLSIQIAENSSKQTYRLGENMGQNFIWRDSDKSSKACQKKIKLTGLEFCLISDPAKEADVVLLGDSHANHFYVGLNRYYQKQKKNLLNLGIGACPPLLNIESAKAGKSQGHCQEKVNELIYYVANSPNIKEVIISAVGPRTVSGVDFFTREHYWIKNINEPDRDQYGEIYSDALDFTIQFLLSHHKKLKFIYDIPDLNFNPRSCVLNEHPFQFAQSLVRFPCALPLNLVKKRQREYRKRVAVVLKKYPQVGVFDPLHFLCDQKFCWVIKEGAVLYRDPNHLSYAGSLYFWDKFEFTETSP